MTHLRKMMIDCVRWTKLAIDSGVKLATDSGLKLATFRHAPERVANLVRRTH